jgi:hypothetical protein
MTAKKTNKKAVLIALLALTVAAAGILIGSFAKYVTQETVSDEAVAATFGLDIPETIDLFGESYTNVESNAQGKNIIAPGTSGSYTFNVTGTSEVAYKVGADVTLTYSAEWGSYEPLKFSLNGTDWTDFATFKTNLNAALGSKTLAPNETYTGGQTIYWQWPYDVSAANDQKDTEMGAAAATGTAPKVTVSIVATATQVEPS